MRYVPTIPIANCLLPEIVTSPNLFPKPCPQVHGAAETLLEVFAGGAHSAAHPSAVSHNLETVVPDIQQVVFMDIALSEGAVDIRKICTFAANMP